MDTIGERLKLIIDSKHLSQGKFGDMIQTPRQLVSNYVNNLSKPNFEFLTKLHDKLGVDLNWFITGSGNMFITTPNEALKDELRQEFEELLRKRGL